MAKRAPKGYDPSEVASLKEDYQTLTGRRLSPITSSVFGDFYKAATPSDTTNIITGFDENGNPVTVDVDETPYDATPVPLTDIPTSSTSAARPRTVAAGYQLYTGMGAVPYDARKGKLTVMFRDGVLYNYYDVTPGEWIDFKSSISKGRPYLNKKNQFQGQDGPFISKPRGLADITNVSEQVRRDYYRLAASAQVQFKSDRSVSHTMPGQYAPSTGGATKRFQGPHVPKNAALKTGLGPVARRNRAKRGGTNPHQK